MRAEADDTSDPTVDLDEVHDQELADQWNAAHDAAAGLCLLRCSCKVCA